MIGIISAMNEEIRLLVAHLDVDEKQTIANREYHQGKLFGKDVVLAFSRWGKVAATQTATTVINLFDIDILIFTGVAGAADPSLSIGDIIISTELVQHDVDVSAVVSMKKFEIPLLGVSHFKADAALIESAKRSAEEYVRSELHNTVASEYLRQYHISVPQVICGIISSGDLFIADAGKISDLRREIPGLMAIEMEGAAVAQVCYEHKIPFVVIRALSDKADHSAVTDFPIFVEHIAAHYTFGIIKGMLESSSVVSQ
ncbi:MAG TPA: 5'-methylthioadenosine/adenosylhomocysteine nucleosidase [Candidatus Kapabacteria bacterium]|nr:5'-methylthioadenosine/adenosylhomocysteine nucleosidase [Candidatus Kapabacteria bacterium]